MPFQDALAYLPGVEVGKQEASMILNGVPLRRIFKPEMVHTGSGRFVRVLSRNRLLAIIEKSDSLRYFKVFKELDVVYR